MRRAATTGMGLLLGAALLAAGAARAQDWPPDDGATPVQPPPRPPPRIRGPSAPPETIFGVHLTVGLELESRPGLAAGLGLRFDRLLLTYRASVHDGGADGDGYTARSGVQVGWMFDPGRWGGFYAAAGAGSVAYRGEAHFPSSGAMLPQFDVRGGELDLEVGFLVLAPMGFANLCGISVQVILPTGTPALPQGVDLALPTVLVRLDLNPLLLLLR